MAIFIELFLMGVGLSMDAFAVSICKGLGMRKVNKKQALVIGLFFGGFQALMPFVGWLLGSQFEKYITSIDHWIAFILLGIIGGKMIVESVKPDKEDDEVKEMDAPLDLKEMFVLAVATSIDALAVGITFAFLDYPIVEAITIIGISTFFYFHWRRLCRKLFWKQVRKESRVCRRTDLSIARCQNPFDTSGYFINNRKNEGGNVYGGDDAVNSFITGGICFIDQRCRFFC